MVGPRKAKAMKGARTLETLEVSEKRDVGAVEESRDVELERSMPNEAHSACSPKDGASVELVVAVALLKQALVSALQNTFINK